VDPYGDPLPAGAIARLGTVRLRHASRVRRVAVSRGGKWLASTCGGDGVWLWDAATGKPIRHLAPGFSDAQALAFSPDGKFLACGGSRIALWELRTGRRVFWVGNGKYETYETLAFSPDGKTLASSSPAYGQAWGRGGRTDSVIRLWDARTGEEKSVLAEHARSFTRVVFSPDGKTLASVGQDRTARLWDVTAGKELRRFVGKAAWLSVAFSPDGKSVVVGDWNGNVHVRRVGSGRLLRSFRAHPQDVETLTFAAGGALLASSGRGGVRLWDFPSGKEHSASSAIPPQAQDIACAPGASTLALTCGQVIRLWDIKTRRTRLLGKGHESAVSSAAVSPDGRMVASASEDGTVRLWDLATSREVRRWVAHGGGAVHAIAFAPDGNRLATGGPNGTVCVWEAATGREKKRWKMPEPGAFCVAFSPDGKCLASAGVSLVQIRDVHSGKVIRELGQRTARQSAPEGGWWPAKNLVFSPDGTMVAVSVAPREELHLWAVPTGREIRLPDRLRGARHLFAFSPDGKTLAVRWRAGPYGEAVSLWEVATGKERCRLQGDVRCTSLAFARDGKTLVGACGDVVRSWSVATGKKLRAFRGHRGAVTKVLFSPDGKSVVSASHDTTVLVWDACRIPAGKSPVAPGAAEVKRLWRDLADPDGTSAHEAVWQMVASPRYSLPLLREHLRPVARAEGRRVARWIEDLDSDEFVLRETAEDELAKLREAVEPALRKALAGKPPPEARRRLMRLLARRRGSGWPFPPGPCAPCGPSRSWSKLAARRPVRS
jgi:WD40 repeat protein